VRNAFNIFVGTSDGKIQLGRPRCRWEDIRKFLREIWFKGVDFIHLVQNMDQWRVVMKTGMNVRFFDYLNNC
jgi:hypothetical protein